MPLMYLPFAADGFDLTTEEITIFERWIASGDPWAVPVGQTHRGDARYAIRAHGQWLCVVSVEGRIVTVLPHLVLNSYGKQLKSHERVHGMEATEVVLRLRERGRGEWSAPAERRRASR